MSDYMVDQTSGRVTARYSTAAAAFHWLTAVLVLIQIYVGLTFGDMPKGPERMQLFTVHKTLGVTILIVALLRLGQRLINPPPPYPADTPKWDRALAVWTHRLFYFLLIALPVTGLAAVSKPGVAMIDLLGGLQFPALHLGKGVGGAHEVIAFVLIAMLVLHIAAAIWHQWLKKDGAAGRMPPFPTIDRAG